MIRFASFYIIELTMSCNTQCEYCYLRENREPFNNQQMSFETFKKTIDSIVENIILNRVRTPITIVLHGGEPLMIGYDTMSKFLFYLNSTFKKYDVKANVSIQTNGILLDDAFIDLFEKNQVAIGISYDGEKTNSLRIKNEKHNKQIYDTIKKLKQKKTTGYGILSVITKHNIDEILDFEKDVGHAIKYIPVVDTTTTGPGLELSPEEIFEKLEKNRIDSCKFLSESASVKEIDRTATRTLVDILTNFYDSCQSTCNFRFCGSGLKITAIMPDGSINKCDRWDLKDIDKSHLTDLDSYDFLGIKQLRAALEFNKLLHDLQKEKGCDTCYARFVCTGQCQSLYHAKHGMFGISPSACVRAKLIYNYIQGHMKEILSFAAENAAPIHTHEVQMQEIKFRQGVLLEQKYKIKAEISSEGSDIVLSKLI